MSGAFPAGSNGGAAQLRCPDQQGTIGSFNAKPCPSSVSSLREAPGLLSCPALSCPVWNRRTMRKARGREQGEASSRCRTGKGLVLRGSSRKPESSSAQGWSEPEVPQAEEAVQGLGKPTLGKLWQKEADLLKAERKGREVHGEAARATTTHPRARLLLPLAEPKPLNQAIKEKSQLRTSLPPAHHPPVSSKVHEILYFYCRKPLGGWFPSLLHLQGRIMSFSTTTRRTKLKREISKHKAELLGLSQASSSICEAAHAESLVRSCRERSVFSRPCPAQGRCRQLSPPDK